MTDKIKQIRAEREKLHNQEAAVNTAVGGLSNTREFGILLEASRNFAASPNDIAPIIAHDKDAMKKLRELQAPIFSGILALGPSHRHRKSIVKVDTSKRSAPSYALYRHAEHASWQSFIEKVEEAKAAWIAVNRQTVLSKPRPDKPLPSDVQDSPENRLEYAWINGPGQEQGICIAREILSQPVPYPADFPDGIYAPLSKTAAHQIPDLETAREIYEKSYRMILEGIVENDRQKFYKNQSNLFQEYKIVSQVKSNPDVVSDVIGLKHILEDTARTADDLLKALEPKASRIIGNPKAEDFVREVARIRASSAILKNNSDFINQATTANTQKADWLENMKMVKDSHRDLIAQERVNHPSAKERRKIDTVQKRATAFGALIADAERTVQDGGISPE